MEFEKISVEYEKLNELIIPFNSLTELTVYLNGIKYEFLMNIKKNNNKLVVLGSGAVPKKDIERFKNKPYYNRWSWKYNCSFICYNDPSRYLHDKSRGLWGVGVENDYYLENIKNIILKIAYKQDILNKNILFYGSSMGGFMSLLLATMVKESKAIADIPQLSLIYDKNIWNQIREFSFDNKSNEYIINNYGYRLDFIEMMKKENYIPKAILILDYTSSFDVETQYALFFSSELSKIPFNKNTNNLKIIINGKNIGHKPLSYDETMYLINSILNEEEFIKKAESFNEYIHNDINNGSSLSKYLTGRIDIKNHGKDNKVQLLNISDDNALIHYPKWFSNEKGKGMIIISVNKKIEITIKCLGDGDLLIRFMGKNVTDENGNRIPIYINFTNIYINDINILETETMVCHDKPYIFTKKVKDSEIIKISASWAPI